MRMVRRRLGASLLFGLLLGIAGAARATTAPLSCGPFTQDVIAAPEPREARSVLKRFGRINEEVRARSYQVLFLGDSLTQRWDEVPENRPTWEKNFGRFDALNAGINGDRSEHLLWRIEHGNLENQHPRAVVLLIGTNDLGHGRSVEDAAEGVRQVLLQLRQDLPQARILLEGLWPRSDRAALTAEIAPVNEKLLRCEDGQWVFYRNPGQTLLDREGRLTRATAPDGLHPSPDGYAKISPVIAQELQNVLAAR